MTNTLSELDTGFVPTDQKLLHLHIHKTAGTSLRRAFVETYGPDGVLFYDTTIDRAIQSDRRLIATEQESAGNRARAAASSHQLSGVIRPLYRAVRNTLEHSRSIDPAKFTDTDFRVMTGHFNADRVDEWGLDGIPAVTVVREPLERSWSHYQHWKRTQGRFVRRNTLPYSDDTTFETFAMDERHKDYQSRFLGGLTLDHIGVSEQLPALFEELGLRVPDADALHLNAGNHGDMPEFDSGFARDFVDQNRKDYELFQKAHDTWN